MSENTNNKLNIYSLDHLKPEVVAVAFAKCSRSPESFADIAAELTDEKSADFHEKWVVGYGHSSVAEHATLHMAIENVSILATKVLEDNRLASYTEKSTRYQVFDKEKYYKPSKIMDSELGDIYQETMDYIYDTYNSLFEPMKEFINKKYPKQPGENDRAYAATNKARACDNTRYMLPTATLTNLGMTANARAFEHAIVKLLSHPLEEMQEIGSSLKEHALRVIPTLIKFANENKYIKAAAEKTKQNAQNNFSDVPTGTTPVEIVDFDKNAEDKLVASLVYKYSQMTFKQIMEKVKKMTSEEKEKIIEDALADRATFDSTVRELEHIYYTFDILMDYGAFRDIQRHRMCTQTNQAVTIIHGYDTPEEIIEAGMEKKYKEVMNRAADLYNKLYPTFPEEAQYVVPLGFRKRVLYTWNLRELHHFIALRSGNKGHISYRRIAQACWEKLNEIHPLLAKYIRVNMEEGSSSWASTMFNPEYNYMPKKIN
jgi:thymidylate synthase ThyX